MISGIPVIIYPTITLIINQSGLFCRYSLNMEIKFGNSGDSRDVESWMPGIPRGIHDGQGSVLRVGITIKDNVVSYLRDMNCPVNLGFVVARHTLIRNSHTSDAKDTMKKIARIKRLAPSPPDHGSPSESDLQEWNCIEVNLLPVNKRSRDIRMSHEPTKELVNTDWPDVREKTWQAEWLRVYQPDHIHWLSIITPCYRMGTRSPGETLLAHHELPVAEVTSDGGVQKSGAVDWADGTGGHF